MRGEVWLAGIPGARETRLTPSKETCRLSESLVEVNQAILAWSFLVICLQRMFGKD